MLYVYIVYVHKYTNAYTSIHRSLSIYIYLVYFTKWFYHSNIVTVTVIGKPGTPLIS